jgi:hypothetical protein
MRWDWNDYHSSGLRAVFLSRHLAGYRWARSEFSFAKRKVYPVTAGRPEFLEIQLRTKQESLIDSAAWYDPLDRDGRPQADWNAFRWQFEAASKKLASYRWLSEWKSAANGRRIELQMLGDRSREFLDFADGLAVERWRAAGLRGRPSYFVLLRGERSNHNIGLALGRDDDRVIVYWTATEGDYPIRHWADQLGLETWTREGNGRINYQYIVIELSGRRHLRTYSKPVRQI